MSAKKLLWASQQVLQHQNKLIDWHPAQRAVEDANIWGAAW